MVQTAEEVGLPAGKNMEEEADLYVVAVLHKEQATEGQLADLYRIQANLKVSHFHLPLIEE
jgi:hypothetical protein